MLPLRSCLLVYCLVPAAIAAAQAADAPRFPTTDDLRHIRAVGAPELSPDGKQVLFTGVDSTVDGAKSHIWVVAAAAGQPARQLTFSPPSDKRGERSPHWAPDGSAVFFLAHRGENTQLFRLDLRGGEAAPYDFRVLPPVDDSKASNAIPPPGAKTAGKPDAGSKPGADSKPEADGAKAAKPADDKLPIDVGGYSLAADGKMIAVWARDPETAGEKKQKEDKADAEWVDHDTHGTRLYLARLKADGTLDGDLTAVAIAPDVRTAVWSPVAHRLLVITEPPNGLSDLGPAVEAFLLDAENPAGARRLQALPATLGGAAFTPDGQGLVFSAATREDSPPGYDELYALPHAESADKVLALSQGFKGQLGGSILLFHPNGSLIAEAGMGTRLTPVRLSLDGSNAPEPLDFGAAVITGLNTNRARTGWVWLAESGGEPEKLCYAASLGGSCTELAIPELAPAGLRSVKPQLVRWQRQGFAVEALLYMPPGAAGKVPLVVDVHGGPFGAWEDRRDYFADFLVGHGWAVLRPNPRGSSNYGVEFAAANKNDLGGGDYEDIMAGVDAALARFPLDATRMALIGYSYGGEMAGFVEGKTARFKAIVSGAPVIDQFSEYGTEGGSWYDRWYFGKPWEHMEDAWRQSPLAGAAHAKTPFLLLQGESDTTDPLGQAEEMYRALRQEGVPVDLVTYPRENHGPLAGGIYGRPSVEPWHGYDGRQRLVEFIDKAFASPSGSK